MNEQPRLSQAERQAMRERCDKATAGEWAVDTTKSLGAYGVWTAYALFEGHDSELYPSQICSMLPSEPEARYPRAQRDANAAFIANARTDLPRLLAALDAADQERERLQRELDTLRTEMEENAGLRRRT